MSNYFFKIPEVNCIANSTASFLSGTDGTSHVTTVESGSNSPLNPAVPTTFKIVASATASESSTSGHRETFKIPSSLRNKKLKLEFAYTVEANQTWAISVRNTAGRLILSTDLSSVSTLPAGTSGKYQTTFDTTDDAGDYTVHWTRTAGSGTATLYMTRIIVGPGIQPQGAVVENIKSVAMTATVNGASPTVSAYGQRVGTSLRLQFRLAISGSAGTGGTAVTMAFPAGYTPDTTVLTSSTVVGNASLDIATYGSRADAFVSGGLIYFRKATTGANITAGDITAFGEINGEIDVPIAEWAGSGITNLAQNDVEYASNSNATNTATDTTSFSYGPAGGLIPNGAVGTTYTRRVKFITPIQTTDQLTLEVLDASGISWIPAENRLGAFLLQNTSAYGASVGPISTTEAEVYFQSTGARPTGATYAANGAPWSDFSTWRWRVKKSASGQAVGFGAATATSMGLLQPVTSMSDELATTLGHKQYLSGTNYNGGLSPTLSASNWTTTRFVAIPYKMQDGTWRLRMTGRGVLAGEANNNVKSLTINGITSKNISDWQQALAVKVDSSTPITNNVSAYISPNSSTIVIIYNGGSINMNDDYTFSGDIELDSKPTWAY